SSRDRPGSRPSWARSSRARSAAATWTRRGSSCSSRTPTPGSGPAPPGSSPRRGRPAARTSSLPITKRSSSSGTRLAAVRSSGRAVFQKACSACHRLEGVGTPIGAELNAIGNQGRETILLHILDPNREVKPQYLSYVLVTGAGRIVTGMVTAETANALTLRRADGTGETVLRIDIEELRSTGVSFMPEGLERQIDVPPMAGLLAYLRSVK